MAHIILLGLWLLVRPRALAAIRLLHSVCAPPSKHEEPFLFEEFAVRACLDYKHFVAASVRN